MYLNSNNNNKAIQKLARRSLHVNPFRNGCMIAAILFSTILMILTPMLNSVSFQQSFETVDLQEQAIYQNLNGEQVQQLRQNPKLSCTLLSKSGPILKLENQFVRLEYIEYSEKDMIPYRLLEGRLPEASNEAVLEMELAQIFNISVGDSIIVNQKDSLEESFTICGLGETTDTDESLFKLYVSRQYAEHGFYFKERADQMYVQMKQEKRMRQDDIVNELINVAEEIGLEPSDCNINWMYFNSDLFTPERVYTYLLIDLGILFVGILVIYSVFYISVISRIPLFGQLSTIGMSQHQIRRFINKEGLWLSFIGSFLGILIVGIFLYGFIVFYWKMEWDIHLFLGISLVVGILTTAIIMLSIQKPVRFASRISPIEASRYDAVGGKENSISLKTHKLTPHSIASICYRRDRKKTFFATVSLVIGGILFFGSVSYICSINVETVSRMDYFREAEYVVSFATLDSNFYYDEKDLTELQRQNLFPEEVIETLEAIPEVEAVERSKGTQMYYEMDGDLIYDDISIINKQHFIEEVLPYLSDQTVTYESLVQQQGIIHTRNEAGMMYGTPFQKGDKLVLYYYNGTEYDSNEFVMAGFTSREYLEKYFVNGGILIPEEVAETILPQLDMTKQLLVKTVNDVYGKALDQKIRSAMEAYPLLSIQTFYEQMQEMNRQMRLIQQILIILSVFGILFSVINMLNTILTTMIARDRELALLEAIGMQEKQIKKMLFYESLYLTVPSIIVSILFGSLIGYGVVVFIGDIRQNMMSYQLPIWIIVIYTAVMIFIPLWISNYYYKKFSKKTLMERLKEKEE